MIGFTLHIYKSDRIIENEPMPFEVFEQPKVAAAPIRAEIAKPKEQVKKAIEARKVFGLSKNTLTSDSDSPGQIEVKAGNTVAKAFDDQKMRPEDEDSLPIPAEEYLVSEMPTLISDIRVPYPDEARKKGIQGVVVFDLLIDQTGKVRSVEFIEGPGFGLNEAAEKAVWKLEFKPAKIEQNTVAVKIRYGYRFILEK